MCKIYLFIICNHPVDFKLILVYISYTERVFEFLRHGLETLGKAIFFFEIRFDKIGVCINSSFGTISHTHTVSVVKEISRLIANSNEIYTCLTSGGMHYCHNYFLERKELLDKQKKGDHKGVRYITNIDQDNVKFAKECLDAGMRIRHVKNLPPMSFIVSDKEMATLEKMDAGRMIQSLLLSNEPAYIHKI